MWSLRDNNRGHYYKLISLLPDCALRVLCEKSASQMVVVVLLLFSPVAGAVIPVENYSVKNVQNNVFLMSFL